MRSRVLIVGGGIGGLSLAGFLAREAPSVEVILVERQQRFAPVGAGITLSGNALRLLDRLGIVARLESSGIALEKMIVADGSGRSLAETDMGSARRRHGVDEWSALAIATHRADLHLALRESISTSSPAQPDIRLGTEPVRLEWTQSGAAVELRSQDGGTTTQSVDLIVGADGAGSMVRDDIPESADVSPRYSGYTCWRGVVDSQGSSASDLLSELANGRTAWELWGNGKRFGIVPIGAGRVYFYACVNAPEKSLDYVDLEPAEFRRLFGDMGDPVPHVLDALAADHHLHHDDLSEIRLPRWSHRAAVLIGDAAHASTPNLGQGAAQAIEDAALLTQLISSGANHDPLATRVREFENQRRQRVDSLQTRAWRLGSVGQWRWAPARTLRNLAMKLTPDSVISRQVTDIVDGGVRWPERARA